MTDQAEIQRFQEIVQMSKSGAFADLKALVDGWVDEAHESLIACLSMDAAVRMGFSLRYQQRICLKREIENWVSSAQQGFDEITEQMRQELNRLERENRPEYEYHTDYSSTAD